MTHNTTRCLLASRPWYVQYRINLIMALLPLSVILLVLLGYIRGPFITPETERNARLFGVLLPLGYGILTWFLDGFFLRGIIALAAAVLMAFMPMPSLGQSNMLAVALVGFLVTLGFACRC